MSEPVSGSEGPVLGVDIGGSGIKAAWVDVETGELTSGRVRVDTPDPATPEAVSGAVAGLVAELGGDGPIGCAFPAIVRDGVTHSAANVDDAWIGAPARRLLAEATGLPVTLLNDADAAGVAEMAFGAGQGRDGTVFVLTFGTGIGSAVFTGGELLTNTELGHMELGGREIEPWASDRARKVYELSWKKWAKRVNQVLNHYAFLFSPDLFIIGGGASKRFDKFAKHLDVDAEVVPAELRNHAGIVGAAYAVRHSHRGTVGVRQRR
ncbi:MAG: ROK family protein [Deinococcus-Thermus bacterium]|jgi:polyphosphate glucokinase|nr:ROK family protein [Deinococcota bacterium]